MKTCTKCKTELPLSKFWKNKGMKDGLHSWCQDCLVIAKNARLNGPMRSIELRQRQNRHLIRTFNMTIEEYETMLVRQKNGCAICGHPPYTKRKLVVDHDHITKKIRGLLCENCNRGLGMFKDKPEYLKSAIAYLTV